MTDRPLIDKAEIPSALKLKEILGKSYVYFETIVELTHAYQNQWKFYGKTIGWQMKVKHGGKALFYLTPLIGAFRISFAMREDERQALLQSDIPAPVKAQLKSAKKYPEGYPLRLEVRTASDTKIARTILNVLVAHRA